MIGGATIISVMIGAAGGVVTLCLGGVPTLCSPLCCGGGTYGASWISPRGSIHAWEGNLKVRVGVNGAVVSNFVKTWDSLLARFSGGSLFNVVAASLMTLWRCSFHIKNGTWQCCGNSLVEPDIR
jgi:hypothetical protein